MLEVKKINVHYGDTQALRGVSLRISEGETVALLGANGAGKTTTLTTISGLKHPSSGSIEFLGKRIDNLPPFNIVELGICQTPQGKGLFPDMTVKENLLMGAILQGAKEKRKENFELVYKLFPILRERRNQLAGTLSGGEQQMLAIGRGLMQRLKLLMLDEPSLGLAPLFVTKVFETIKKLHEAGITLLLVDQNCSLALEIADRSYIIEIGRIIKEGSGTDLLHDADVRQALGL